MTTTEIRPGARVRIAEEVIGTVERVEAPEPGHDAPGALLVRADNPAQGYRFPLSLVATVGAERDHAVAPTIVQLYLAPADLVRYAVRDDADVGPLAPGETLRIPLAAEELAAETRPVRLGTVRLHTGVETVEQRLTAPLTREEVIVERIPADQYDASAPTDPDETVIPVLEERLVVETRTVVVAYVRVRKRRLTDEQEVRAPVRREVVTVAEQRDAAAGDRSLLSEDAGGARRDDARP
jgi:uncharacterized protein (TIGR02271 family)